MKYRITLKDPDGVWEGIRDAAYSQGIPPGHELYLQKVEDIYEEVGKWFGYLEYITLEIDTDAQTCVVVPSR